VGPQRSHAAESAEPDYSFRAAGVGGRTRPLRIRVPGLPSLTIVTIHVASAGRSRATESTRQPRGRQTRGIAPRPSVKSSLIGRVLCDGSNWLASTDTTIALAAGFEAGGKLAVTLATALSLEVG
jgi:hypothetical protein